MTQAVRRPRIRVADERPTTLRQVEARRRQLLSLVLIVLVLVAAAVVLFSIATGEDLGLLNLNVLRGSFVALSVVFALYVWERERDLRRVERALMESERHAEEMDALRREHVATLTHDLKAPLTSILGYASLLSRLDTWEEGDRRSFVDTIERQGRRILGMVERLMVATRLEESGHAPNRERLDVPRIVREQVEGLRGMLGDRGVDIRMPEVLPTVWGDRSSVEQALVNLLDNAVKYSPDGSTIRIEVTSGGGEISIGVVDEGDGIPGALLPVVFDRYRRATEDGDAASIGLGLFIVKSLVEAQGGRARAENEPGGGARVTFTLPVRRDG